MKTEEELKRQELSNDSTQKVIQQIAYENWLKNGPDSDPVKNWVDAENKVWKKYQEDWLFDPMSL